MNFLEERATKYKHYRMPVEEFEKLLKEWFKKEKKMKVDFHTATEGPDDYGYLGDYYFDFDYENLTVEEIENIDEWYGEGDILKNILKEIFGTEVERDFDMLEEVVYIYVKEKDQ